MTRNEYFSSNRGKILEFSGTVCSEVPRQPPGLKTTAPQGILKNKNQLIQQQRIAGHNLLDKENRQCAHGVEVFIRALRVCVGGGNNIFHTNERIILTDCEDRRIFPTTRMIIFL